jgi:hypothetical protein
VANLARKGVESRCFCAFLQERTTPKRFFLLTHHPGSTFAMTIQFIHIKTLLSMKTKVLLCFVLCALLNANAQTMPKSGMRSFEMPNLNHRTTAVVKDNNVAPKQVSASIANRAEEATVQVDLYLDFDPAEYRVDQILFCNDHRYISQWDLDLWDPVNGSNIVSIPSDTYEILVTFVKYGIPPTELNVIREQITIDQDTQLTFNPEEAKNHIHFQTLTLDGEPVRTNRFAIDENDEPVLLEQGNIDEVYVVKACMCENKREIYLGSGNFGTPIEGYSAGGELDADFFVNDVSERFTFYNYRVVTGLDYEVYASSYEVKGASGDVTITNDPSEYVEFEYPLVSPKHQGEELYQSYDMMAKHIASDQGTGWGFNWTDPISDGQTYKYYMSATVDESEFFPTLEPSVSVKSVTQQETPWGDVIEQIRFNRVMRSIELTVSNDKVVFANNGVPSHTGMPQPTFRAELSEELNGKVDYQYIPVWPTHPVFTYSIDKKKDQVGDNCPLLVTNPMQYSAMNTPFGGVIINKSFVYNYIGRYGEINLDDVDDTQVKIQVNGEDFYEAAGAITAPLDDMNGIVDASFQLGCTTVDGLPTSNKTLLHYATEGDSPNPPTMTMLHLKDSNGDVTDRFTNVADGTIEFSAGDFNLITTPMGFFAFDRQAPETVLVEYAPYGTEDWNELPIEELPEYFWPVMGAFYRGSLAGVTGQAEKGWFDLKFRLEDAAGNWQEQVISPAFRIDDLAYTSVASIGSDNAHEVARYSIDGKRVDANHRGVTIVKMSDGTARKILVK